ncbi:MAG: M23 family metallopeptidase [Myxococcota bacterium]|nr:M23 family metallopeptidase [Myxococcota bacterium]
MPRRALQVVVLALSMAIGALAACIPRPAALAGQARRLASHVRARPATPATSHSDPRSDPTPADPTPAFANVLAPHGWMDEVRRCGRRGRRFFCDGPRRVPRAFGEAARLADRLRLGTPELFGRLRAVGPSEELLAAVDAPADDTLLWPVPSGFLGRGFGFVRRGPLAHRRHKGVDIPAPRGAEVRSTNAGLVVYADNGIEGYGNLVVVLHADATHTAYAHLRETWVFAGETVTRGQGLGEVGTTGLSYAPHLHFEWWRRALPKNPTRHFAERPSAAEERRLQIEAQRRREALARATVRPSRDG